MNKKIPSMRLDEEPLSLLWRFTSTQFKSVHERELTLTLNVDCVDQKRYAIEFNNYRVVACG